MTVEILSLISSFQKSSDEVKLNAFHIFTAIQNTLQQDSTLSSTQDSPSSYFLALLEFLFAQLQDLQSSTEQAASFTQLLSTLEILSVVAPAVSTPILLTVKDQFFLALDGIFELSISLSNEKLAISIVNLFVKYAKHHFDEVQFSKKSEILQFFHKLILATFSDSVNDRIQSFLIRSILKVHSGLNCLLDILTGNQIKSILSDRLKASVFLELLESAVFNNNCNLTSVIERVFELKHVELENRKLALVLKMLVSYCEVADRFQSSSFLSKWILLFGDVYTVSESGLQEKILSFLQNALTCLGCDQFYSILPFNFVDNCKYSRAWLLAVSKDAVWNSSLDYFFQNFLPLLNRFQSTAISYEQEGKSIDAKVNSVLASQIWDLLSSFCLYPTDFETLHEHLFKFLLDGLKNNSIPPRIICRSMNNLIISLQPPEKLKIYEPVSFETVQTKLKPFLKVILPELFSCLAQDAAESKSFVFDCIRNCISVSEEADVLNIFTTSLKALLSSPVDTKQSSLIDMLTLTIAKVSNEHKSLAFKYFTKQFETNQSSPFEKKWYKALKEIIQLSSPEHVSSLFPSVLPVIQRTECSCLLSRLEFLLECMKNLQFSQIKSIIPILIPEALIASKEMGDKVRNAATDLLLVLGLRYRQEYGSIQEFCKAILTGLAASSPLLISATIHMIGIVCIEFELSTEEMLTFLDLFLQLRSISSNEIVRAVFEFVKITFKHIPNNEFLQKFPSLVPVLIEWSSRESSSLRLAVRNLFEKFTRRWGYDVVSAHVPDSYQAVIRNIRKKNNRKQRASNATCDSDTDTEQYERKSLTETLFVTANNSMRENSRRVLRLDDSRPTDLLDAKNVLCNMRCTNSPTDSDIGNDENGEVRNDRKEFMFNADGKLEFTNETDSDENQDSDDDEASHRASNNTTVMSKRCIPAKMNEGKKQPKKVSFISLRNAIRKETGRKGLQQLKSKLRK